MPRTLLAAVLSFAAAAAIALAALPAAAQDGLPLPPGGFHPPPAPPPKPYATVAVTPPKPYDDPSFTAFRGNLAAIAKRGDRAALAKVVVTEGFFWVQEKDLADPSKPGIDYLAKAVDLDDPSGPGWQIIGGFAADPTASDLPDHKGVVCAPADPGLDIEAFAALIQDTQTDPSEWGYPSKTGTEVRAAARPDAPVIETLGSNLVRVLPDSPPPENANAPAFLHVALPSGKTGFVLASALTPLGSDQMCYVKDAAGWKITGYFGGASP